MLLQLRFTHLLIFFIHHEFLKIRNNNTTIPETNIHHLSPVLPTTTDLNAAYSFILPTPLTRTKVDLSAWKFRLRFSLARKPSAGIITSKVYYAKSWGSGNKAGNNTGDNK